MKDILGTEIQIGDYIVYATLYGRSAGLKIGLVVGLESRTEERYSKTKVINRIRVKGIENWFGRWQPMTKISTLQFPDRVTVIGDNLVSEEFKEMIGKVGEKDV